MTFQLLIWLAYITSPGLLSVHCVADVHTDGWRCIIPILNTFLLMFLPFAESNKSISQVNLFEIGNAMLNQSHFAIQQTNLVSFINEISHCLGILSWPHYPECQESTHVRSLYTVITVVVFEWGSLKDRSHQQMLAYSRNVISTFNQKMKDSFPWSMSHSKSIVSLSIDYLSVAT